MMAIVEKAATWEADSAPTWAVVRARIWVEPSSATCAVLRAATRFVVSASTCPAPSVAMVAPASPKTPGG